MAKWSKEVFTDQSGQSYKEVTHRYHVDAVSEKRGYFTTRDYDYARRDYVRSERRKGFAVGGSMIAAGLLGAVGSAYYGFSVLPNQISQVTTEIQDKNHAPTETAVTVAKHRLKSNDCDGNPCRDQERRSDEVVLWRDKQIKAEIADRTGYLENRKLILPLGFIGFLGLSALGEFVSAKTDEAFSNPWDH